jgi:hypothetical protein
LIVFPYLHLINKPVRNESHFYFHLIPLPVGLYTGANYVESKIAFTDPANAKALAAAHFPADFNERTNIQPGTNGYPDVCTWRDLTFYIQAQ